MNSRQSSVNSVTAVPLLACKTVKLCDFIAKRLFYSKFLWITLRFNKQYQYFFLSESNNKKVNKIHSNMEKMANYISVKATNRLLIIAYFICICGRF